MNYLYVFIGGFFGAIFRYLIAVVIPPLPNGFPVQTFLINMIGCFIFGLYKPLAKVHLKPEHDILIGVGFVGAFTTFSAFSIENVMLFDERKIIVCILYIFTSLVIGIGMSYIGYRIGNKFYKLKGESSS
jgi:fluoride exporter